MNDQRDGFEPYLGRMTEADWPTLARSSLETTLLRRVGKFGGNPRKLRSSLAGAKLSKSGRFNLHGRGAAVARALPRQRTWTSEHGSTQRVRMRRVVVRSRLIKLRGSIAATRSHLRYLERDGVQRDGQPGRLYSTFADEADRDRFLERSQGDRHQFRFMISPEDGSAYDDFKVFTREVMAQMEQDLDTTLDWVAADHFDTGHPHVHIVLRGALENGRMLFIAGDYIAHSIHHRASEVLTRDLGPQTEWELQQQLGHEVGAEHLTRLDRALQEQVNEGEIDLGLVPFASDEFGQAHRHLLIARLRRIEAMGLAERKDELRWSISGGAFSNLAQIGERQDQLDILQRAIVRAGIERPLSARSIYDPGTAQAPLVGQVIGHGAMDEVGKKRWLAVDALDGRTYYIGVGEAIERPPFGGLISVTPAVVAHSRLDRTIAQVAALSGGRYSVDLHLGHNPSATETFAERHAHRLAALWQTDGNDLVGRTLDGVWLIPPDYLDRIRRHEERRIAKAPVSVELVTSASIQSQIEYDGATWLDRQLLGTTHMELADQGFGTDVHKALVQRQKWLIEQGVVHRDGVELVFRSDVLDHLRRREARRIGERLSKNTGLTFIETKRTDALEGIYRGPVELVSGRHALIEKSREFRLVPWRSDLEQRLGQFVSATIHGDTVTWGFGRARKGPSP